MMARERNLRDSLLDTLESLLADEFDRFKHRLSYIDYDGRENIPRCQLEEANTRFKLVDLLCTFYCEDGAVNVAICVLTQINRRDAAAKLTEKALGPSQTPGTSAEDYRMKYRKHIQKKYQLIKDRNARLGENVTLNSRYTKLIIVNKYRHEKEREHEIMAVGWRHAEIMSEQAHSSITIDTLFKPDEDGQMPQIVVLLGAAGIGKTMTARKIMLDWAAGRLYHEFDYVFYINCREMNLLTKQGNMADMILKHCPNNSAPIKHILENTEKLLFIIDGFDELRFSFDQPEDNLCSDPWEKKPVEIILSSLFRKTVLSECYLVITTRPTALEKLRQFLEYPRYAEILGFSKEDREEYFNKFFRDEKQATTAFNFVCENEILLTMCFVPIVCWIICTVLKQQMERGKDLAQTSKTLTEVYLLYLFSLVQSPSSSSKPHMQASLRRLCSLAVDGLWKQKILFEEEEIKKHGLDQVDSLPLFLNENIFQKDIDCECAYSFIHLTFQEFFAALFYVLEEDEETMKDSVIPNRDVKELLIHHGQSASCLITVHFLFGLLNKNRMKDIEEKLGCKISHEIKPDLKTWVISSLPSNINQCYYLEEFYYLYEIQEENFVKNALEHLTNLETWEKIFTQMDQMVLSFCVKHCHQLESLLIHYCVFRFEDHEEEKFPSLPKWLCQGQPKRSSIYLLCQALEDPNCKLKKLQLNGCFLSITSCWRLAAVLRTNQSLTELDLGYNQYIGDSGVQLLCEGLKHPNCKLQTLGLWNCDLKGASCGYLAAVLRTSQSLTKLELRDNVSLGDSGVQLLCEGLKHPNCKLQRLGLGHCSLTAACCGDLSSASSTSQRLTELELENKKLGDSRVQLLWEGPPDCNKQMIQLPSCSLTIACCGNLSSVLSTSQTLTELDLKNNTIRDSGVQLLCEGLKHPNCKLQKLGLRSCSLTAACCGDLSCVLSTSQALTELDIGGNKLGQSGVQLLCEGLKHPNCKLQKLILEKCGFTAACCRELSSALSTSQTLTELDLRENKLEDSGVKLLCEGLTQPACNLQKLVLSKWHVTKETRAELDAVKKIKPDLVIET